VLLLLLLTCAYGYSGLGLQLFLVVLSSSPPHAAGMD
jgi:hypothetical protein